MKWTKEVPTEPGYYWMRWNETSPPFILDVWAGDFYGSGGGQWFDTADEVDGAEFQGPIYPQ